MSKARGKEECLRVYVQPERWVIKARDIFGTSAMVYCAFSLPQR